MCDGWSGVNNVEIADTTQSGHQQHMHSNRGVFFLEKIIRQRTRLGLYIYLTAYCCACTEKCGQHCHAASADIYGSY